MRKIEYRFDDDIYIGYIVKCVPFSIDEEEYPLDTFLVCKDRESAELLLSTEDWDSIDDSVNIELDMILKPNIIKEIEE